MCIYRNTLNMRIWDIFVLTFFFNSCYSQIATIIREDGSRKEVQIVAHNTGKLTTKEGVEKIRGIDSVYFATRREEDAHLYGVLEKWRVKIMFADAPVKKIEKPKPVEAVKKDSVSIVVVKSVEAKPLIVQSKPEPDINDVVNGLDRYRKQKGMGYALQILGAGMVAGTLAMQVYYSNKYYDDLKAHSKKSLNSPNTPEPNLKKIDPLLPAFGGGLILIGFVIHVDALRHLKLRK